MDWHQLVYSTVQYSSVQYSHGSHIMNPADFFCSVIVRLMFVDQSEMCGETDDDDDDDDTHSCSPRGPILWT